MNQSSFDNPRQKNDTALQHCKRKEEASDDLLHSKALKRLLLLHLSQPTKTLVPEARSILQFYRFASMNQAVKNLGGAFFGGAMLAVLCGALLDHWDEVVQTLTTFTNNVLDIYMNWLDVQPVITKSVTTAVIQFLGDVVAQTYDARKKGSTIRSCYDARRGLSLAIDGLLLSGPLLHYAFELMERVLPTEEESNASLLSVPTLLHVVANDYLVDSLYLTVSFVFVAVAEGHSLSDLLRWMKRGDLWDTIKASWTTSIALMPIEYFCFHQGPLRLRVLAMNVIDILWGAIISFVAHRSRK